MKLSVVICTKNEERNIGRCLKAAEKVADEIIVFDSNSQDKTRALCQEFSKVRFHSTEWKGFSTTKNEANAHATGDYILSLDADEFLSEDSINEILKIKSTLRGVYSINRMTNYCGTWIRHSGWFPDRHIRLFPKKGSQWVGTIHETLKFDSKHEVQQLEGIVEHYSYYTIDEHRRRIESYSDLGARQLIERKKKNLWFKSYSNAAVRFLKCYVFKLGFLDGAAGWTIAVISAQAVHKKYMKAWRMTQSSHG
jgi:glycosyltransferase involved in cell wall biosynthesis